VGGGGGGPFWEYVGLETERSVVRFGNWKPLMSARLDGELEDADWGNEMPEGEGGDHRCCGGDWAFGLISLLGEDEEARMDGEPMEDASEDEVEDCEKFRVGSGIGDEEGGGAGDREFRRCGSGVGVGVGVEPEDEECRGGARESVVVVERLGDGVHLLPALGLILRSLSLGPSLIVKFPLLLPKPDISLPASRLLNLSSSPIHMIHLATLSIPSIEL
jgi:hypothetical protein